MAFVITVEGLGEVEIVNWEEVQKKILTSIGFQLVREIQNNIKRMKLIDTGDLFTSIDSEVINNELIVFSTVKYAPYLEYGTLAYFKKYGLDSFIEPLDPKKKDIPPEVRKKLPSGMQPFGYVRRILYNETKMADIIQKGFNSAK